MFFGTIPQRGLNNQQLRCSSSAFWFPSSSPEDWCSLLFALTIIFGEGKPEQKMRLSSNLNELAVYPLAVPSIASPGAMMAIVLLTDNHRFSLFDQTMTTLIMLSVLLITYFLFLAANRIQRWIGNTGAAVISRVMGLILAAVAINNMLVGIRDFFTQMS